MLEKQWNVAIFIFDEVEVLDFCGPFEVFSVTGRRHNLQPFNVYTVAKEKKQVLARNALSINPHYSFADCPPADILLIPGGYGTRQEIHKPDVLQWVRENSRMADLVLSVCTGSFVLAKAGLLEGLTATTHHRALAEFQKLAPHTTLDATKRFVDNGTVITSAGISAGIDMALYVVAKLLGKEQANETAEYMEYDWKQSETDEVMR